jgi:hypothetical protein
MGDRMSHVHGGTEGIQKLDQPIGRGAPLATYIGTAESWTQRSGKEPFMLRKRVLDQFSAKPSRPPGGKNIEALATVAVTSEAPGHPIDNAFDGRGGPGGSCWIAADPGEQALIVAFDAPQEIREIDLEVEEPEASRTQEVSLGLSRDGGQTYREVLRQEYNFAPPGTTFEREQWAVNGEGITHVRLVINPDKSGRPCRATVTSFALR